MRTKFTTETQRAQRKTNRDISRCAAICVLFGFLAGCIPAEIPPHLQNTPGAAVVVTDRTYSNDVFSIDYPAGWRIVTGEAAAPSSMTLVAPDERSLIVLQVGGLENANLSGEGLQYDLRTVELDNGEIVTATGRAPVESWAEFLPVYEAVLATLKAV